VYVCIHTSIYSSKDTPLLVLDLVLRIKQLLPLLLPIQRKSSNVLSHSKTLLPRHTPSSTIRGNLHFARFILPALSFTVYIDKQTVLYLSRSSLLSYPQPFVYLSTMPYVPPGPSSSSQAIIPRRSVVKAVLDETREKSRGSTAKHRSGSTGTNTGSPSKRSDSISQPDLDGIDLSASTGELARQLEVTHIAEPAITTNTNLAGAHADVSEPLSDASTSSVARTDSDSDLEAKRRLSVGNDAVTGYKHALYQYTVGPSSQLSK
jgi:hypothetical protein